MKFMKKSDKGKKLATQINTMVAIIAILLVVVMISINAVSTQRNVSGELIDQCVSGTNLLSYALSRQENISLEDKTQLLDELKEVMGAEFTIFEGDVRAFTTIIIDGQRATGTTLDPTIADIVLNKGETYTGETSILGINHYTSYMPHYGENGEIIGVIFAGLPSNENDLSIVVAVIVSIIVGIIMIVIVGIVSYRRVVNIVAKPLAQVTQAAQKMAVGEMDIEIDIDSDNEIGLLANSFTEMKDELSKLNEILVNMLSKIAKGEWDVDIGTPDDYIGDWKVLYKSLDTMVFSVRDTLSQVSSAAEQISTNVSSVSSGAQSLANGSIEQADSVNNLSNNLHEITNQIDESSKNTKKVNDIALISGEVTQSTLGDMKKMVSAMNEISSTSEDINKVIKVIDDIAFQTNILALNAAVEAARAGSAGKGFAVVADEVRNLAQKSSQAAKNTADLIEQSISAVQLGESIALKTNVSFEDLAGKVSQMVETIDEIAKATDDQASAIKQISKGIDDISSVVQANSAMSEQSAAASEELAQQADVLHGLIEKFKL